ncbi:MAG: helix-turn-helix transcriptional regulator [Clostridia bacterium]|nr:helix-turn-helix transcriptional regulator [Clostridia bacterium]
MKHQINDFNFSISSVIVAHTWTFFKSSTFNCEAGRNCYGLVHILSGQMHFDFLNGKTITLTGGDTILLKPSDKYISYSKTESTHYTVNFNLQEEFLDGEVCKKIFLDEGNPIVSDSSFLVDDLENLSNIWKQKDFGYRVQAISLTNKLLLNFIKRSSLFTVSIEYIKIQPALKLIEKNWNKELSLETLARECNLSVSHFRHLFVSTLNIAPMEYRDSLRLLYAKDYLMWKSYSIKEVANICGFEDVNYFNRFFKKHIGVTPSKYLKK